MNNISIICPVKDQDWERFAILYGSLKKHLKIPYSIISISPSGKCPIKDKNIISYSDIDIIPELIDKKFNKTGWWKQQALKLASYDKCDSETILILDADCFMVRDMTIKDVVSEGKIHIKISKGGSWDNWYQGSNKVLNLDLNYKDGRIGVTPVILSKKILQGLHNYLTTLYSSPWVYLLSNTEVYDKSFDPPNSSRTWTEYCLYHTYGVQSGLWEKYHINTPIDLSGNCFWTADQADTWNPAKSFDNPQFFFTVAQSISGKPAEWVKEKIKQFL